MFTRAETNLMVIYNTGTRSGLITELEDMMACLEDDETELIELTYSTLVKLKGMTNEAFLALDLTPDKMGRW